MVIRGRRLCVYTYLLKVVYTHVLETWLIALLLQSVYFDKSNWNIIFIQLNNDIRFHKNKYNIMPSEHFH